MRLLLYIYFLFNFIFLTSCEPEKKQKKEEEEIKDPEYSVIGYPTKETVEDMFEEMAYHGATQAYLWGTVVLVNDTWRQVNLSVAGPLDFVTYNTLEEKYNTITSNLNTPYMLAFPNLSETGPLILEVPAGPTGGLLNDIESRNIGDIGLTGPDQGEGGKYLILHESWEVPENHNADFIYRAKTNLIWVGTRILTSDDEEVQKLQKAHKIYPLGQKPETNVVSIGNKVFQGWQPEGLAFWEAIHRVVQEEDFPPEDRYILQFLERVGIEKGKEFKPSIQQKKILRKAASHGKAMAESLSNGRRFLITPYYNDGTKWTVHYGGLTNANHVNVNGMKEFDGLVSYCWEAFSVSEGMMQDLIGAGSKYLATYEDQHGDWLNGSFTYELDIPANVPAEKFWSFIVYSQATRTFIENKDRKPGLSSKGNLYQNIDGSFTITMGPKRPKGVPKTNFLYTNPNEGWFAYFRCYDPKKAYYDKTWRLPDIKRIK
ncbi:DUF1214 domain-containing protein [Sediminitomix flava]|uniref:DUF1254 domain-containing protein n=1 Tax=Sediminitomix flava TaxID=379075 RepID=A0A315Z8U7_SEDFL|nr:DUF1214 domain-containing protein [Sediminitomix flava]PWJ41810.1 hypothetical protein BC781_10360 [Sediminitomix flava]